MTTDTTRIEPLEKKHWPSVHEIYCQGIDTGNATFETHAPDWENWDRSHMPQCRLVARRGDDIVGWAALSPVSARQVYSGVAEVSVYVAEEARGSGVGKALLERLVIDSEACGIWTLQAGIFPENAASIVLHKSCGFREVGRRERLGKAGDSWRDVILMERRSKLAGT